MRASVVAMLALLLGTTGAYRPVRHELTPARTAPDTGLKSAPAEAVLQIVNGLGIPVNVYVVRGRTETFIRQVPASSTRSMRMSAVVVGDTIGLRAAAIDGTKAFTRQNVVVRDTTNWQIP